MINLIIGNQGDDYSAETQRLDDRDGLLSLVSDR